MKKVLSPRGLGLGGVRDVAAGLGTGAMKNKVPP